MLNACKNVEFGTNQQIKSSTNLIELYKQNYIQNGNSDTIYLNKDLVVLLSLDKEKNALGTIIDGKINNKDAMFKTAIRPDLNESWYEGALNNQYFLFHSSDKGKLYDGKYGNDEFRLNVAYNEPSLFSKIFKEKLGGQSFIPDYFTVTGYIGDRKINISLPNANIPHDEKTKDLLALILDEHGLKAQTINNEIKSLAFSAEAIKYLKTKIEKRDKLINNDIKPIIMQGVSSALGLIVGSVMSALLLKAGLKKAP